MFLILQSLQKKDYTLFMNLTIRFHPNTEHILAEEQRSFLYEINNRTPVPGAFPVFPLYCPLTASFFAGKKQDELKNSFSEVKITELYTDDESIFFKVEIKTSDGQTFSEKIKAGTAAGSAFSEKKARRLNLNCSSFQVAEIKKTGFTYELWNPVWCKCRKH